MPVSRIFFHRLAVDARIGILDHEREGSQPLHIDAEIDVDLGAVPAGDEIGQVLDYRLLREALIAQCRQGHVNLLETLATRMGEALLAHPPVLGGRLRIAKPTVFADCDAVGIEYLFSRSPS